MDFNVNRLRLQNIMRLENYGTKCENEFKKKFTEGINFCAVEHMKIIKLVISFLTRNMRYFYV